jgi:hypothetical protein
MGDPISTKARTKIEATKNPLERLAVGQMAAATIIVAEKKDTLAVPAESLEDLGGKATLCVVRGGKSVVLHPQRGVRDKHWVEVTGTDMVAGERVIVEGGYNLPDGSEVTVEPTPREREQVPDRPVPGKSP